MTLLSNSSRLIVKNLPPDHKTEEKLRNLFGKFGTITDASLKFTSSAVFRRFAFVGFENESSCKDAISKMNNSFVQGYKLMVEPCQRFNSENKPRPWSKYTRGTSAYKRHNPDACEEKPGASESPETAEPVSKKAKIKEKLKKKDKVKKVEEVKEDLDEKKDENLQLKIEEKISDTGRLFVRNLSYICTEDDIKQLFEPHGALAEIQCIIDKKTGKCKGFAIVTYIFPENALVAYKELDGSIFKGRMLHILPGEEKVEKEVEGLDSFALSSFQKDKAKKLKQDSNIARQTWNTLFLGSNAVAEKLAEKYEVEKRHLLMDDGGSSAAVRMAMAETKLVKETREFFLANGVCLDAFSRPSSERSKTVIIIKNLPARTSVEELERIFGKYGETKQVLLPPERGISAIIEMDNEIDAKSAFTQMAYFHLRNQPLYLEWAPFDVFDKEHRSRIEIQKKQIDGDSGIKSDAEKLGESHDHKPNKDELDQQGRTKILARNVPFQATQREIKQLFSAFGEIKFIRMPKKPGTTNEHRGFCFVDFLSVGDAKKAFESLVHSTHLYGRRLVLEWAKNDSVEELIEKSARKVDSKNKKEKPASKKKIQESIGNVKQY